MSVQEVKATDTAEATTESPQTVTEAVPATSEQESSPEAMNETTKSTLVTPTNEKKDVGIFPKLKRNLTTKLHVKPESEKVEVKEGENQPSDSQVDANTSGDACSTPTAKSPKRLSVRANEIFHDIRGAFKQPLIASPESKEDEENVKNARNKNECETDVEPAVATEGEENENPAELEAADKEKKEDLRLSKRLSYRVQDLVRGAFKQPLIASASDKKEEDTTATKGESNTEGEASNANKASPKQTFSTFSNWFNIFGVYKAREEVNKANTEEGQSAEPVVSEDPGEGGSPSRENSAPQNGKPAKESSIFAFFHSFIKDPKNEANDKKVSEEVEPKSRLSFFKNRKSVQKEILEGTANPPEPVSKEVEPVKDGEEGIKEGETKAENSEAENEDGKEESKNNEGGAANENEGEPSSKVDTKEENEAKKE